MVMRSKHNFSSIFAYPYFHPTAHRYIISECQKHFLKSILMRLKMKGILITCCIAISHLANCQILEDILDGKHIPDVQNELIQPLLLSMSPQSGIPHEVVVMLLGDFDPDSLYNEGMNPQLSEDIQLYAVFNGAEQLVLPLFEAGVYSIVCLDEDDNYVGEGVTIVVNDNFVSSLKTQGYVKDGQSMAVSIKPLRIGREATAFISFNSDTITD